MKMNGMKPQMYRLVMYKSLNVHDTSVICRMHGCLLIIIYVKEVNYLTCMINGLCIYIYLGK